MLRKTFTWGIPLILLLIVTLSFSTSKTFRVETVVPASPEVVWNILTDTSAYPDWNPVFVEVSGTYAEGVTVNNKVKDPTGTILEMEAFVEAFIPNKELRQSGGMPGVITFDHRWTLEEVEGGTKITQYEVDRGIGLWFWNSDWIIPSYTSVNEALADRVKKMSEG